MKSQIEALAEHKYKIIDTYIDWKKNKLIDGKVLIIPRTCIEQVLKSEIIRNYQFFGITEFYKGSYKKMVDEKKIFDTYKGVFTIQTCIDILDRANLIKDKEIMNLIKRIQLLGNDYGHRTTICTTKEVEIIDENLFTILNWFFTNSNEPDWLEKYVNPKIRGMYLDIAENIADELKPLLFESNVNKKLDIIPFDTSIGNFNILILSFRNTEVFEKISPLGENLIDGLNEKNERENLGLQLKYIPDILSKDAEDIGKKMNADMVIWGNDSKPYGYKSHFICFHYLYLSSDVISEEPFVRGKTEKFEIDRLFNIAEGNLQLEIDDIIYWFRGYMLYLNKEYNNALNIFNKIDNKKYLNENLYFYIAVCYYYLIFFDKSKKYFEKAIKSKPNFVEAHYNYAFLLTEKFNDIKKAKKHFLHAIEINPDLVEAHYNYAVLLHLKFDNKEAAKVHYKKVLEISPDFDKAHLNYAFLLHLKFDNKEAAKVHYEKVLEISPNDWFARYWYARLLMASSNINENENVKEHFKKVLEINPDYSDAHYWYAYLLFLDNSNTNKNESAKHFKRALEINPMNSDAHYWYANLLLVNSNENESAKHFKRALEINPNNSDAHYGYAHLLMASSNINDNVRAKVHFKKAVKINPNNFHIHYWFARLLMASSNINDNERAKVHFKRALEINPNNSDANLWYTRLLMASSNTNKKKSWKEYFQKACKLLDEQRKNAI